MSDMPRPPAMPPAPDHERHDALLVAQFVAGDPLAPEQRAQAQRLVSGCGACASLAADLPAISRAVAQEPVPPRRRDFRLAPQQAEELRGNALTRVLRRLSLPSSRAFQPAAAGVLSIGLLFVVAGYAWPDGGTVTLQAEPNLAEAERPDTDGGAALEGADRAMEDPAFADTLAQSQAGLTEESMQKSVAADEGAPTEADAEPRAAAGLDAAAQSGATSDTVDASADDTAGTVDETAGNTAYGDDTPADEIADPAQEVPADISAPSTADEGVERVPVALEEPAVPDGAVPDAEIVANADDGGAEDLLIVLGLALALGGGGLLLLGWLARRARDPLAP